MCVKELFNMSNILQALVTNEMAYLYPDNVRFVKLCFEREFFSHTIGTTG